jgi:hypothetical protein
VAQRPFLSTATRDGSQPPPLALVAPGGGAAGTPASAVTATKACAGVRFGPGTLLPLPYKESSWPEDHLSRKDATRATWRGAPKSASTGGEGVAMARPGCGRPALAFTSTCYTSPRPTAGSQHKSRSSTAAIPDTARRRQGPLFPGQAGSLASSCLRRWITARVQRWGAPASPPCSPCDQHQNGATAKTRIQRRDARLAPGLDGAARGRAPF